MQHRPLNRGRMMYDRLRRISSWRVSRLPALRKVSNREEPLMKNGRFVSMAMTLFTLCGLGMLGNRAAGDDAGQKESASLVYELRTYTTAPGRLPALHKRFREHTMKLFEKHGMKNVIYWTPVEKENTLVYIVAHQSQEAAKKSWAAFGKDPDWRKAFAASRADGPIVTKVERQYLNPTDYSPLK